MYWHKIFQRFIFYRERGTEGGGLRGLHLPYPLPCTVVFSYVLAAKPSPCFGPAPTPPLPPHCERGAPRLAPTDHLACHTRISKSASLPSLSSSSLSPVTEFANGLLHAEGATQKTDPASSIYRGSPLLEGTQNTAGRTKCTKRWCWGVCSVDETFTHQTELERSLTTKRARAQWHGVEL